MSVKIKLLSEEAKVPTKGSKAAAGYDLYTPIDYVIDKPGRFKLPLDLAIQLSEGTVGWITSRSGFALKGFAGVSINNREHELRLDCDVLDGKVDADFRGNVSVIIKNNEEVPFLIPKGTRIAQLIILKYEKEELTISDVLDETERGDNGFNSSGIN